jgi:HlyD family secretion protein
MSATVRGVLALAALGAVGAAGWWGRENLGIQVTEQTSGTAEAAPSLLAAPGMITALGRIEPKDGVIRVAGPSRFAVVIAQLMIDDGDEVRAGEPIAILDSHVQEEATVQRLQAELENANREFARNEKLRKSGIVSDSELDEKRTKTTTLEAELTRAKALREQSVVRAPISGRVIEVHARAGEKVGADGIAELGRTDIVNAIAEVYETDIAKVRLGQRAVVTSAALAKELHGTVSRIGRKIGKKDVLATDPAADTDARVIDVEVRLDDPREAADLTNLRVDVAISAAPQ